MKTRNTKSVLLRSVLALFLCFAMLVGTTFAWFTDSATSEGNKIVSGSLKIDLELFDKESGWSSIKNSKSPIFNYDNWEPGYVDAKLLKIDNEGSLAFQWKAKLVAANDLSKLADVIDVYVCLSDTELTYPNRDLDGYNYEGTLSEFVNSIESVISGELLENESVYLGIAFKMQESAGNEYQETELGAFDIQIFATQLASEDDSFDNQYDAGAEYDGEITNADGFVAAMEAGGTYQLLDSITLDECAQIGEEDVTIDLNGNSITAGADGYVIENTNGATVTINAGSATSTYAARNVAAVNGTIANASGSTMIINGGVYNAVDKYAILNESGDMTLNNVTINGTEKTYPLYSYSEGHKITLNDVTVNGIFGCVNTYGKDGVVVINGGNYTMTGVAGKTSHIMYFSTGSDVTINGGTFAHVGDISMSATGGGGICAINGAKLTINDGNFAGDYADMYNWGGTGTAITVNGGNFKFALPANTIPAGSTSVKGDFGYFVVDMALEKVAEGLYVEKNANDNRYYIANGEGLASFNTLIRSNAKAVSTKATLLADIDFEGKAWTPVDAHYEFGFSLAEFDGNGHTIYNLTINGQAMFTRFVNYNETVTFKNVTFDGATVNSNGNINTAIIVAHTYNNIMLDNVDVHNSSVTGGYKVAAFIGTVYNESASVVTATIKNCDIENCAIQTTGYDFGTCGFVGFVYVGDNDKVEFENSTIDSTTLSTTSPHYTLHAFIYYDGENCVDAADGVTVTNCEFVKLV